MIASLHTHVIAEQRRTENKVVRRDCIFYGLFVDMTSSYPITQFPIVQRNYCLRYSLTTECVAPVFGVRQLYPNNIIKEATSVFYPVR